MMVTGVNGFARHHRSIRSTSACYAEGCRFDPHVRQHFFMEFGHEIISKAILSLPLI